MSEHDPFLAALWRIQEQEGLTARALAARLGVSEATISRYRGGSRQPSATVTRRVVQSYPRLLGYLMESEAEVAESGPSRRIPA